MLGAAKGAVELSSSSVEQRNLTTAEEPNRYDSGYTTHPFSSSAREQFSLLISRKRTLLEEPLGSRTSGTQGD